MQRLTCLRFLLSGARCKAITPDGLAGRRGSVGRRSADSWHLQPFLNGSWDCISIGSLVLGLIFNFEAPLHRN